MNADSPNKKNMERQLLAIYMRTEDEKKTRVLATAVEKKGQYQKNGRTDIKLFSPLSFFFFSLASKVMVAGFSFRFFLDWKKKKAEALLPSTTYIYFQFPTERGHMHVVCEADLSLKILHLLRERVKNSVFITLA